MVRRTGDRKARLSLPRGPAMIPAMEREYYQVRADNVSLSNMGFIILLKREHGEDGKVLPIFIGAAEAQSIAAVLNKQDFPRPLTHDLFKAVLAELGTTLERVHVTSISGGTFYARAFLDQGGRRFDVDSRPSDAIALALRFQAPIFVHRDVYAQAAVDMDAKEREKAEAERAERLKTAMDKAIAEERYEEAAKLRDELKKLRQDN